MTQAADGTSKNDRIFKELQSIRGSQKRMESILGRILRDHSVSPPNCSEASEKGPTGINDARHLRREEKDASRWQRNTIRRLVSWTDLNEDPDFSVAKEGHKARANSRCMSPLRASSPERGASFRASCEGCASQGSEAASVYANLSEGSFASGGVSDTFIAATLPLSWPTVLAPRKSKMGQVTSGDSIRNTVMACSRMRSASTKSRSQSLEAGKGRQLCCTMYPGTTKHMVFCSVSCIVTLYDVVVIPLVLAWDLQIQGSLLNTNILSVLFWTLSIGLSFMTAFRQTGKLVVLPTAIAKQYLRTWFLFDLLTVSVDWANMLFPFLASSSGNGSADHMRPRRLMNILRLLRIFGILRICRFSNVLWEYVQRQTSAYCCIGMKIASLLLGVVLLIHTMCCAWYGIGKHGPSDTGMRWTDNFNSNSLVEHETYQYLTSYHWAAAQIMLGATDVNGCNSMERFVNIACMLVGLIFSSTLVSSLSATLVDLSISHKDRTKKLAAVRKFLKANHVSAGTCLLVQDQVSDRLKGERSHEFSATEYFVKNTVARKLFEKLRHEIFFPIIKTHPLLCLWSSVHESTVQRLAVEALESRTMHVGDDLFVAGGNADTAYFIVKGELEYVERPDSSPRAKEVTTVVGQGTWLYEPALWSEWIHVGTATMTQWSSLVLLKARELQEVASEHAVVKTVVAGYGEAFHSKIISAVPPEEAWPSDLAVPNTSMAHIVISMSREARIAIGLSLLSAFDEQPSGVTGFAVKAFGGLSSQQLSKLKEELHAPGIALIPVGAEMQRVVSIVCVRILDGHRRVLVQIGKFDEARQGIKPVCQLPGQKVEHQGTATEKLAQVLEDKLPFLAQDLLEIEDVENQETGGLSPFGGFKTTYFRTAITACHSGVWEAEEVPVVTHDPMLSQETTGSIRRWARPLGRKRAALSSSDDMLLQRLLQYQVSHVTDMMGAPGLYVWLPEVLFDDLRSNSSGSVVVAEWISRLAKDFSGLRHESEGSSELASPRARHSRFSLLSHMNLAGRISHHSRGSRGSHSSKKCETIVFPTDHEQEPRLSRPGHTCFPMYPAPA